MIGHLQDILVALNEAGARYLVVGGVAVLLHGHMRTTMDLDLVVQLETGNLDKALTALSKLGYQPTLPVPISQFKNPEIRESWAREKNMVVFTLWKSDLPLFKVDIFVTEPFDFSAAYERSAKMNLGRVEATVVALSDLLSLKRTAGRLQDLADIEALEAIERIRGEEDG